MKLDFSYLGWDTQQFKRAYKTIPHSAGIGAMFVRLQKRHNLLVWLTLIKNNFLHVWPIEVRPSTTRDKEVWRNIFPYRPVVKFGAARYTVGNMLLIKALQPFELDGHRNVSKSHNWWNGWRLGMRRRILLS
jgi:hypothetical protein